MKQTKVGNHYVEFDVPTSSLKQTNEGWAKFSVRQVSCERKQPVPQMPAAENIVHKATKIR